MPDEPTAPAPQTAWRRIWRSQLLVGFISGVLSSLVVAWYLAPSGNPRLMFRASPSRSVVVAKSDVGGLRVLHGDQEIKGDVTAVQVSLWNEGRGAARESAVMESVRIVTSPPTTILAATLQKVTRPLTAISLDTSALASGVVPVRFRIFEEGDAALIQLVYAGPPSVDVAAAGVLEGQPEIQSVHYHRSSIIGSNRERAIAASSILMMLMALFGTYL